MFALDFSYLCKMGKSYVWDPLRKKDVLLTPEEGVRQWFIRRLNEDMHVPMHMMMSESGFRLGEKQFRADIIIYGRDASPVGIVECKRPGVVIDGKVLDQAVRYNMVLSVKYIFITNGNKTYACKKTEKDNGLKFEFVTSLPGYEEMAGGGKTPDKTAETGKMSDKPENVQGIND